MEWQKAEMPDDALDPNSLVKRIIDADKVRPDLIAHLNEFMDKYANDFKALAASERAELPLWRVMADAGISGPCNQRDIMAAEIEALRDWLLPEEPEPSTAKGSAEQLMCWGKWNRDHSLRAQLTDQARIARGES